MTLEDIRILNDQNRKIGTPRWNNWPKEKENTMENKEPDYPFTKEIADALVNEQPVYVKEKCEAQWKVIITDHWKDYSLGSTILKYHWALEKPKIKIKKWLWIIKKGNDLRFTPEPSHIKPIILGFEVIAPYMPSEIEVEE
jgi:hypothetical protein